MFIIETIPISRGIKKESLSYFSKDKIPEGSIVSLPLRKNSSVNGIVVASKEVSGEKLGIRKSDFALKKIGKVKTRNLFSKDFIESAKETSRFFAGTTGSVLNSFIPRHILENSGVIATQKTQKESSRSPLVSEHFIVQDEEEERFSTYKSLIREEFAKNKSVYLCLPSISDARKTYLVIEKGIGQYAFLLHSSLPKKELLTKWGSIVEEKHPVVVIATAGFLSLNRGDWGLFILDKEGSKHYKAQTRPFVDTRIFAEILANKLSAKVVFGDIALRTETIWRYRRSELSGVFPPKFKYLTTTKEIPVDMRRKDESEDRKKILQLLSEDFLELIKRNKENNDNMFIFSVRRGLSPITACYDCGSIIRCKNCDAPTVLHRSGNKNVYMCHRCNNVEASERRCESCESWNLAPYGVGIELVEKTILENYPDTKIFRIDGDKTKTEKKVLEVIENWQNKPGSVLLGTEMALPYLPKIENIAIASIDSLFSVPDFRINEKIFSIILFLRSLSSNVFLVQTRNPEQSAIRLGISGNLLDFYKEEIKEREEFNFPPFGLFIKISLSGSKEIISKEMKALEKLLEDYELDIFSGVSDKSSKKYSLHALLRIKKDAWIKDDELYLKLSSLPPKFTVKVDPEALL